jgi:hypothetical protein
LEGIAYWRCISIPYSLDLFLDLFCIAKALEDICCRVGLSSKLDDEFELRRFRQSMFN